LTSEIDDILGNSKTISLQKYHNIAAEIQSGILWQITGASEEEVIKTHLLHNPVNWVIGRWS